MRKISLIIFVFLIVTGSVIAGVYEDALRKNEKVFLYLYTPECNSCREFDSVFYKLKKQNKDYEYVKVNANTSYGRNLAIKYRTQYVPFILLTNSKSNKSVTVRHTCFMDEVCLIRAMKSFNG